MKENSLGFCKQSKKREWTGFIVSHASKLVKVLTKLSCLVMREYVGPVVYPSEFTWKCTLDWKNNLLSVNANKSK
jgi:hypothetical protein